MLALILFAATCKPGQHLSHAKCVPDAPMVDPKFKRSERGWIPSCPDGMQLTRQIPQPACFWGVAPMHRKSSQGEFSCRSIGALPKLKACPVD